MEEWLIKEIEQEIKRLEKSDKEAFHHGASYALRWVLGELGTWENRKPASFVKAQDGRS